MDKLRIPFAILGSAFFTFITWLWTAPAHQLALAVETPTVSDLTTAAGVATLTCALIGLLVKPWLDIKLCGPDGVLSKYYKPSMNLATFLIAELLANAALFVDTIEYHDVLTAFLVGAMGAAAAVGIYEVTKAR